MRQLFNTARLQRSVLAAGVLFVASGAASAAKPDVTGTGSVSIADNATTMPFGTIGITDSDAGNTVVVTITYTSSRGTFPTAGSFTGTAGSYTLAAMAPAAAEAFVRGLTFTPTPNRIVVGAAAETTTFTVSARDNTNANSGNNTGFSVAVTAFNDQPTISVNSTATGITDKQTRLPFSAVTIGDVDNGGTQAQTVTVVINTPAVGGFQALAGVTENPVGTYKFSGTPSAVATKLTQLRFDPTGMQNRVAPGMSETVTFTVSTSDGALSQAASPGTTLVVTSANDSPTLTDGNADAQFTLQTGNRVSPFAGLDVSDPDVGETLTATIDLTATLNGAASTVTGSLSGTGLTRVSASRYTLSNASATALSTALQGLIYFAQDQALPDGQDLAVTFTVSLTDGFGGSASTTATRTATLSSPSLLTGVRFGWGVWDFGQINPFGGGNVANTDGSTVILRISLDSAAYGGLLNPAGFVKISTDPDPPVYEFVGSPIAATNAARAVTYKPLENIVPNAYSSDLSKGGPPQVVQVTFSLFDADAPTALLDAAIVAVYVYPFNNSPTIGGTEDDLIRINEDDAVSPFTRVVVTDVDDGGAQLLTVRVAVEVDQADPLNPVPFGTLAGGGFSENPIGSGIYELVGVRASDSDGISGNDAQSALRELEFTPTLNLRPVGATETVSLEISVDDQVAPSPAVNNGTNIVVSYLNGRPVITTPPEDPVSLFLDQPFRPMGGVTIDDEGEVTVVIRIDNPAKGALLNGTYSNITDYDDDGGLLINETRVSSVGHGLVSGDMVRISGFGATPTAYNDVHTLTDADSDSFVIPIAFQDDADVPDKGRWVQVFAIDGYSGTLEKSPVTVTAPNHGLTSGDLISLSGYGGTGAYNGTHQVTVLDPSTFTIAEKFVDDVAPRGEWMPLAVLGAQFSITGSSGAVTDAIQGLEYFINGGFQFPPGQPGFTRFTITATDTFNNVRVQELSTILALVPTLHVVTNTNDDGPGSLRDAIRNAAQDDHIGFAIGLVAGEAKTISLESLIEINKHLTIHGVGADRLIIRGDGGAVPHSIFALNARLDLSGVTLSGGNAAFGGGAIAVQSQGQLVIRDCRISGNSSLQWGGGIDVDEGSLLVERCLFDGNMTDSSLGIGGGAISIYSDQTCSIINSTFSGNGQLSGGGKGGGAIYAENVTPETASAVLIQHCTFTGNVEGRVQGTSIHSHARETFVYLKNSIFNDAEGQNLEVSGGGRILSLGGNLSDDESATVFSQGGIGQLVTLLDHPKDKLGVPDIGLEALADNGGSTMTHALGVGSPALSSGVPNEVGSPVVREALKALAREGVSLPADEVAALPLVLEAATDQRGYWRDWKNPGGIDSGAFERDVFQHLAVNEIQFAPIVPVPDNPDDFEFIEIYNTRASDPINLEGFRVLVDGIPRHTFTNTDWLETVTLNPATLPSLETGMGRVLAASTAVSSSVPLQVASPGGLGLNDRFGTVTILNSLGQVVTAASYAGSFASTGSLDPTLLAPGQSVVLSPQFTGGILPHRVAQFETGVPPNATGGSSSGDDLLNTSLNGGNAPPIAIDDRIAITEDELINLDLGAYGLEYDLLGNDIEFDRLDVIRVVDLERSEPTSAPDVTSITTANGAAVVVEPSGLVSYDPTDPVVALAIQQLPAGEPLTDSFAYTIRDEKPNPPGPPILQSQDPTQRVLATAVVTIGITGVNDAPIAGADPEQSDPNPALHDPDWTTPEDQKLRILADATLLSNPSFFGEPDVLQAPTHLLKNDSDIDLDNDNDPTSGIDTLLVRSVTAVGAVPGSADFDSLATTSSCGAVVTLDVRFDRRETHIIYDPTGSKILNELARGERVVDTFNYTIVDQHGAIDIATVSIVVVGVNDGPTAAPDGPFVWNEDTDLVLMADDLLENDSDPDTNTHPNAVPSGSKDTIVIESVQTTSDLGAEVVLDPGATMITYKPGASLDILRSLARDEVLSVPPFDTFTYTITDRNGEKSTATVSLSIVGINDTPVAVDDRVETSEDSLFKREAANGLFGNDSEFDINGIAPDDLLRVLPRREVTPNGGLLSIEVDGSYSFDPTASPFYNGLVAGEVVCEFFTYTAFDTSLTLANDDSFSVERDSADNVLDVLANDRILSIPLESIVVFSEQAVPVGSAGPSTVRVQAPSHGVSDGDTVFISGYDGEGNYNGMHRATRVDADHFVIPVPFMANDNATTAGGWKLHSSAPKAIDGYSATMAGVPGGVPVTSVESEGHGLVDGMLVNLTEYGGQGSYNGLHVIRVIDADHFTIPVPFVDGESNAIPKGFWSRPPGGIVAIAGLDKSGTAAINETRDAIIYSPLPSFVGVEKVEYVYSDGLGGMDRATVSVKSTVDQLNGNLSASDDRFTVGLGTSTVLEVLLNDNILPETAEAFLITGLTRDLGVLAGDVIERSDDLRSLRFTPAVGQAGERRIFYEVSAGGSARATATVIVNVVNLANTLMTNEDRFSVELGSSNNTLDVLANDGIRPGSSRVVEISSRDRTMLSPASSLEIAPSGDSLLYTPDPALPAGSSEKFEYTITDASGATGSTQAEVTVRGNAFDANDDFFTVILNPLANPQTAPYSLDLRLNDRLIPATGDATVITDIGLEQDAPPEGEVAISGGGASLLYTPKPGSTALEEFRYEIGHGTLERAEGVIRIEIVDRTGALDPNSDAFSVALDSAPQTLRVLENDLPLPLSGESWVVTGVGEIGDTNAAIEVSPLGDGVIYTPKEGFIGFDEFEYTVSDGLGGTGTASVEVKVGDLPTNEDRFAVLSESTLNFLEVLANDNILPDDSSTYLITGVGQPDDGTTRLGGSVVVSGTGAGNGVLYTPPAGIDSGTDSFNYLVVDASGRTVSGKVEVDIYPVGSDRDSASLSITVVGTNDAPTITGTIGECIDDNANSQPFSNVTIEDADEGGNQILRVGITLSDGSNGILRGTFQAGANGFYFFEGTAADVTDAIQGLTFVPNENSINVGQSETTTFSISIDDGFGPSVLDGATESKVISVNDPPQFTGTRSDLRVHYKEVINPFAGVTVSDPDHGGAQVLGVSVEVVDSAQGVLTGPGITPAGAGVYTVLATAAEITEVLRNLVFHPSPDGRVTQGISEVTQLILSVSDGVSATVVDPTTMVEVRHSYEGRTEPADQAQVFSKFGAAVQVDGTTLAVGAPEDASAQVSGGSVSLYERDRADENRWIEVTKLAPADAIDGGLFGRALALSGDTLVVGAPGDDDLGVESGSVYLYERNQGGPNAWGLVRKITSSDGSAVDLFGISVALDGDLLVVGAPQADNNLPATSGAAYVFRRDAGGNGNWGQVAKLMSSNGVNRDYFGNAVSISGGTIAVGAWGQDAGAAESGLAYVFEQNQGGPNNWGETAIVQGESPREDDVFGFAVAVDGDLLVVGAHGDTAVPSGFETGSAFLFGRDVGGAGNWGLITRLDEPEADQDRREFFGFSVAIDGDRIVIGAPSDSSEAGGAQQGAIFTFARNQGGPDQWGLCDKLVELSGFPEEELGFAVDIDFHTVVAGSPGSYRSDDIANPQVGAFITADYKWNNGPRAVKSQQAVETIAEQGFLYTIPDGCFGEPDRPDSVTVTAASAGGGAIPAWLTFDPVAGTLAGTPAEGTPSVTVTLTGTDADGEATSYDLTITILPGGPYLYNRVVAGVDNTRWTTVTLPRSYNSMVVVATPVYGPGAPPMVSRIRNVGSGNTFQVRVQRADGQTAAVTPVAVQVVVVEAGVYTAAMHGIKLEAARYPSAAVGRAGAWGADRRTYGNTYRSPVVLGQVMSFNDTRFSSFWSRGDDEFTAPTPTALFTGMQIGEDPDTSRSSELLGYIVLEAGTGQMRSVDGVRGFVAGRVLPRVAREPGAASSLDFSSLGSSIHDPGAANNSTATVLEGGRALLVSGGGWQSVPSSFNLTDSSVLEFEFLSKEEGLVHGIGFDNDSTLSSISSYQLWGTDTFGRQSQRTYPGNGSYAPFRFTVGSDFTGTYDRLTLAATSGTQSGGDSYFRNVRIQTGALRPFLFSRGLSGAETAVLSMQRMTENDGGWPVLQSLAGPELGLAVDEDTLGDAERSHTIGDVAYLVFGPAGGEIPIVSVAPLGLYGTWLETFYPQSVVRDPALEASVWGFLADSNGNRQPTGMEYTLGTDPTDPNSTVEPFSITLEANGDVVVRYRYRTNDPALSVALRTSTDGVNFVEVTALTAKSLTTVPDGDFTRATATFDPSPAAQGLTRIFQLEVSYSSIP